jgi:23S rRNA pseudouridine2605 synthase
MHNKSMRLGKLIAISGIASRREAENIILSGKVTVNNITINSCVTFVNESDKVIVDGLDISKWLKRDVVIDQTKIWVFHKPKGVITSRKDPQGRMTIFSILPKEMSNIITVGRLDYNTEGLILLTNNGAVSRFFELPQNNIKRVYKCKVFGPHMSINDINAVRDGITIDGINYKNIDIKQNDEKWFTMVLREGKNREIRKIFKNFGIQVSRLIRTQYGEFKLDNLQVGDFFEVNRNIVVNYASKV